MAFSGRLSDAQWARITPYGEHQETGAALRCMRRLLDQGGVPPLEDPSQVTVEFLSSCR